MSLEELREEVVSCRKCPRLVAWREEVARTKRKAYLDWDYWGKPVPGFGDPNARVLVVGLAPGAHGSNRTGRNFTGDASGNFLYAALYRAGFSSRPDATSRDDGLALTDMYITACGRCAPPKNKPTAEELNNCQPFLERELEILQPKVIVCLGRIAFDRIKRIYSIQDAEIKFAHGAVYKLDTDHPGPRGEAGCPPREGVGPRRGAGWLLASYHPSQQNTLTGKLTVEMFDAVWAQAQELIETL